MVATLSTEPTLRCRWCSFETPLYQRLESGVRTGPDQAYARMMEHAQGCHPAEYSVILAAMREYDGLFVDLGK